MATFTITIPDDQVGQVTDAICTAYRYDPASGITATEFARQSIISYIKALVTNHQLAQAQAAALAGVSVTPPVIT